MLFSPIIHPLQCDNTVSITGGTIVVLPAHKLRQDGNFWAG